MQHVNRAVRISAAVTKSENGVKELFEIAILSLAGLALTLFIIASYAGSDVLMDMFTP
jgi:hypothetical protein